MKHLVMASQVTSVVLGAAISTGYVVAEEDHSLFLEEILVTAQKREQNMQDVGISVTAFSGDMIGKLGLTNSIDLAAQTPGLLIQQQHPNVTTINIRGVSQNDFASHLEAPVAVYVDDAYVSSMGAAHAQMYDLNRVEVLRGPQGTLFGRNATGGLLHYISEKPTENFEGYGKFTVGDYDHRQFEGAISGAITESFLGRLSVATNQHDGVLENRIGTDLRAADAESIRGQLQFNPSDELQIGLKASYSKDDTVGNGFSHQAGAYNLATGLGSVVPRNETAIYTGLFDPFALITGPCPGCDPRGFVEPDNDPLTGAFDFVGEFKRDIYNYQANISWETEDITFTSITDYFEMEKDYGEDTDGSPIAAIRYVEVEDRDQFSQEFRLSGDRERLNWAAGLYYLNFETDTSGTVAQDNGPYATFVPAGPTPFPPFNDPSNPCLTTGPCPAGVPGFVSVFGHAENIESQSWAIFGHTEYELSEAFTLIAALRYTEDEREMDITIDNAQVGATVLTFNPDNTPETDRDFENISAKLQIDWRANADWLLYAGYTRGHKAGNFTAPLFLPMDISEIVHDEEVLNSYEAGAKGSFMDGRARLNFSVFYYDYEDYQASSFVQLSQRINNVDATLYGTEVELILVPTDALELQLGASLLETEAEDVGMPDGTFQDQEMPNAPPVSINGLARYTWSAFGGSIAAQFDFNYNDEFCFTVVCHPSEEEDSYMVSNARIGYTSGSENWEIVFFVNNLGDEEYRVFGGDASFVGNISSSPANPRWYGATVSYRWGE